MTVSLILITGFLIGFSLRLCCLRLPLEWDHGILLYQSYWYNRTGKFLLSFFEDESQHKGAAIFRDTDMIRSQLLGMSFIYIIIQFICRDRSGLTVLLTPYIP
jgi:hypothetical protein